MKAETIDLITFADNQRNLYQTKRNLFRNYGRKVSKHVFDETLAIQGFRNLVVTPAAREYSREYGCNSRETFSSEVREEMARHLLKEFRDSFANEPEYYC